MSQLALDMFEAHELHLTVSTLTRQIKYHLETSFMEVVVEGEISSFKHHSSGHMYFSLVDENAQISAVMWRSRNWRLFFTPRDGMKVLVRGRVSVYEKRGSYQIDVLDLKPAGIGDLQMAFEQLKNRLLAEGLFDLEHKRRLPRYPERIGVITSPSGAALHDLMSVIQRRFPPVEVVVSPVPVQGEGAAAAIAHAIQAINDEAEVDVIIVTRGGGAYEDLWAFNEEVVARAVYDSRIPVVSAIGHEVDFTICDFIADLRAPTPSAAGELVVPDAEELLDTVRGVRVMITGHMLEMIAGARERLTNIRAGYGFRQPQDILRQQQQRLDEQVRDLNKALRYRLTSATERAESLKKQLRALSHDHVLRRGYSLCHHQETGELVTAVAQLAPEDRVAISFYDGRADATITEVLKESTNENGKEKL